MCEATIRVVHGFGVASVVFRPLLRNLGRGSITASLFRYPFGPLLDHRSFLSDSKFQLPSLPECCKLTTAGRFDLTVPIHCTRGYPVDDFRIVLHTHNTMLASARVANLCVNWIRNNSTPDALAKSSSVTSK